MDAGRGCACVVDIFSLRQVCQRIVQCVANESGVNGLSVQVADSVLRNDVSIKLLVRALSERSERCLVCHPQIQRQLRRQRVAGVFVDRRFIRFTRLVKHVFRPQDGLVSLANRQPMRALCLNANLRVRGAITRWVGYFLACLLYVIPDLRRATLVRVVPCLVGFVCRFVVVFARFRVLVRFKRDHHFRRLRGRRKIVNNR